jgi:hypothetical protein
MIEFFQEGTIPERLKKVNNAPPQLIKPVEEGKLPKPAQVGAMIIFFQHPAQSFGKQSRTGIKDPGNQLLHYGSQEAVKQVNENKAQDNIYSQVIKHKDRY